MAIPNEVLEVCSASDTPGLTKRVLHKDCSEGKDACLVVKRVDNGWVYKCHRCGLVGGVGANKLSPKQVLDFVKPVPEKLHTDEVHHSMYVPVDAVPLTIYSHTEGFVPAQALKYLLSYRIQKEDYCALDAHYSPWYNRIVFPVRNSPLLNNDIASYKTMGWVGRLVGEANYQAPKWLIKKHMPCIFHYHKYTVLDSPIILVEDILSAYRVFKATHMQTIALFGTNLSPTFAIKLKRWTKDYKQKAIVWLDSDAFHKSVSYWKKLCTLGIATKYICTPKDPKAYDDKAIKNFVEDVMK